MSSWPAHPVIYEINTWVWLNELSRDTGRRLTLSGIPDDALRQLAELGFDAVWLMGVWRRSPGAREVARTAWRSVNLAVLPDCRPEDVPGSPFAIYRYEVDPALGSDEELAILRRRLASLGLRLILDFMPNHLALDHEWVAQHPEWLIQGDAAKLAQAPQNYFTASDAAGHPLILAHGRDPFFDGWPDTVQVDFRRAEVRRAMIDMLLVVAEHCDGVRCDMAMLLTRAVFLRTWGGTFDKPDVEFWPTAIGEVKARHPNFTMIAEVYWDMEWELQQLGFDFTYDKRLYDRLRYADARSVRMHLVADLAFQRRLVRFVENHDEERALSAFGRKRSQAVAVLVLTLPGMRLLHDGQIEGRRVKLPVQLGRRPTEPPEPGLAAFYGDLLTILRHPVFHDGTWQLLETHEAWPGNPSHASIVAHRWSLGGIHWLVVGNLAPHPAQCYLPLALPDLAESAWQLRDLLSDASYVRDGNELSAKGLYLDLSGYGCHLLAVEPTAGQLGAE